MTSQKSQNSNMLLAFLTLLGVIVLVAVVGFFMLRKGPEIIQGQAEVTEYRVSSKVPGRILEFGHLHLEGADHRRSLPEIPTRTPRHVQRRDEGAGHRRRENHRRNRLFGMPRHFDRLRHHGEGRQRIRPLRRFRLERRRHVGLGLPAFAQGPLRQRRA